MTPNEILTLAKKRVANTSANILWDQLFAIAIDEIFTYKPSGWKFAQQELAYIHPQNTFEYTFDSDPVALALMKIKSIRISTNYVIVGLAPVPVEGSGRALDYEPYQRFMELYPDNMETGTPELYTDIVANDGTNGLQIGIFPRPSSDTAVWIMGDFVPSYTIDDNPLPILPVQFHRLVFYAVVMHAADEAGQDKLSIRAENWFRRGLIDLERWEKRNPNYKMQRLSYNYGVSRRKGPYFPDNFPAEFGRR